MGEEGRRVATDDGRLSIRIIEAPSIPEVVRCFRLWTGLSVSAIRRAVGAQELLLVSQFYGLDHDEVERRVVSLIECLQGCGATVEIVIDGEVIDRELLVNLCRQWREIGEQTHRDIAREMGYEAEP
jgi:hypothetical protein